MNNGIDSDYKQLTVYRSPCEIIATYLCPGPAKDLSRRYCGNDTYLTSELLVKEGCVLPAEKGKCVPIYKAYKDDSEVSCPYFLSPEEVMDWASLTWGEREATQAQVLSCNLFPYIPKLPKEFDVDLVEGADGRFSTFVCAHPDLDGYGSSQKIFFPDRSWKGVKAGRARVKIVHEKDTYGFIVGYMLTDHPVLLKEALNYCWNHAALTDFLFVYLDKDRVPQYAIEDSKCNLHKLYTTSDSKEVRARQLSDAEVVYARMHRVSDRMILVEQAMDLFHMKSDAAQNIFNLQESQQLGLYLNTKRPRIDAHFRELKNLSVLPQKVVDACKGGALSCYYVEEYPTIRVFNWDLDNFHALLCMSSNECKEVVEFVSRSNTDADVQLKNKVHKGTIRVLSSY